MTCQPGLWITVMDVLIKATHTNVNTHNCKQTISKVIYFFLLFHFLYCCCGHYSTQSETKRSAEIGRNRRSWRRGGSSTNIPCSVGVKNSKWFFGWGLLESDQRPLSAITNHNLHCNAPQTAIFSPLMFDSSTGQNNAALQCKLVSPWVCWLLFLLF